MTVEVRAFGSTAGGAAAHLIDVDNGVLRAWLTDYGARLTGLVVPGAAGSHADVVLGYDDVAGYELDRTYMGATCGRYGNRIRAGRFTLDGRIHQLDVNEPPNHLHGGSQGFHTAVWDFEVRPDDNRVSFSLRSPDGHQGYPGALDVTTSYRLQDSRMIIEMSAVTSAPTVVNLVHHSYWNLDGHDAGSVLDHQLRIDADRFTPVDDELIPTGELRPVDGTPVDFRSRRPVADGGLDHNLVLRNPSGALRPVLELRGPVSGRSMVLATTEPALQLYTGANLGSTPPGKFGARYQPNSGLALECQRFPDGPNQTHFPETRLDPGDRYHHRIELTFAH